ncbi:MAG: hypothetical protein J7K75_10620 [Desulfuromonas sp.]|nr:hypothetical protein [Desulfuromonas sp.]
MKPLESDWKKFRKRVPEWRERYLSGKNTEIVAILTDESRTPTEQFWDAKERMETEAQILKDCLDGHSRSSMFTYMLVMFRHKLIVESDLSEFSDELREQIVSLFERFRAE